MSPTSAASGTPTTVSGKLPTKVKRKVVLQVRTSTATSWRTSGARTTTKRGAYRFTTTASGAAGWVDWRVRAPKAKVGAKRLKAYTSPSRRTTIVAVQQPTATATPTSRPTSTPTSSVPTPTPTVPTTPAEPRVSAVTPTSGSALGGEVVTVDGTNLLAVAEVWVGASQAIDLQVLSASQLRFTTPFSPTAGAEPITLRTATGTLASSADFTYVFPTSEPTSSVTPAADTITVEAADVVGAQKQGGAVDLTVVDGPRFADLAQGTGVYVEPGSTHVPAGTVGRISAAPVHDAGTGTVRLSLTTVPLTEVLDDFSVSTAGPLESAEPSVRVRYDDGETRVVTRTSEGIASKSVFDGFKGAFSCKDKSGNPREDLVTSIDFQIRFEEVRSVFEMQAPGFFQEGFVNVGVWAEPVLSYDATVSGAVSCGLSETFLDKKIPAIPIGTTGATIDFGPYLDIELSAGGRISYEQRLYRGYSYIQRGDNPGRSTPSGSADPPKVTGGLSAAITVRAGGFAEFGFLDTIGVRAELGLSFTGELTYQPSPATVTCSLELAAEASAKLFLDVWVTRWEYKFLGVSIPLFHWDACEAAEPDPEPPTPQEYTGTFTDVFRVWNNGVVSQPTASLDLQQPFPGSYGWQPDAMSDYGPIPQWLSLSSSGLLTGTPPADGATLPMVIGRDSAGVPIRARLALAVNSVQAWSTCVDGKAAVGLFVGNPASDSFWGFQDHEVKMVVDGSTTVTRYSNRSLISTRRVFSLTGGFHSASVTVDDTWTSSTSITC
ncbi:IPT/TIG domain-containing protein [Nocardioides glacieisoli]|uniref:IPT/TIG domain-containing protein n=1 Tax=Nocardioides glacieisoli TaxID=1168730 RepID=UPI0013EC50CD|nr:IPT/TIG domain-containing protein [Nocardioides glacieisoli]